MNVFIAIEAHVDSEVHYDHSKVDLERIDS